MQRFLDPAVLHSIDGLDLVAKTVVEGFVAGIHRSPDFGFSQEFTEYRAYTPGDDLRHVDWNVYARTDRCYLKRYRGETNTLMTILLDASNSMKFSSHNLSKMDYARFAAASLFYLAIQSQRDAAGLMVFDDEVRLYIRPSGRQGQLHRLLAGLDQAEPHARTNFFKPLEHFQSFVRRRGMVVVISDFYEDPDHVVRTIEPLRFHGNEVILFHVLDPQEIKPELGDASLLIDLETGDQLEVTADYARNEYRAKMNAHMEAMRDRARASGMDYYLLDTSKPLDGALREYLTIREGRFLMGFLAPWFLGGLALAGLPVYLHLLRRQTTTPHAFSSLKFFERRTESSVKHRRLRYLLLMSLRLAVLLLLVLAFANPFINRTAASISGEKLMLLVVDDSFSMHAGTRLADARQQALSVLSTRNPAERAQVVALGSQLHVLTEPTQDSGALRAAISGIMPGDSRGSFGALASAIRSMAENVRTPIELHLFSDMQKSAMPPTFSELALPQNVTLILHPVVKDVAPNWAVAGVNAPGEVYDPKKAHVEATIAGYHTPAATRIVSLVINGKTTATQPVMVPANGRATVDFQSLDVPYGFSRCEVRIDSADTLPADDTSRFAVERSDPRQVLFVHEPGDSRSPLYFRTALSAAAQAAFSLEVVPANQTDGLQPSKYAFVVLSDVLSLPSTFENNLVAFVRNGGSVLIAAGTNAASRSRIPVTGDSIAASLNYSRNGQSFQSVGDADPTYPSIEKAERWSGVKFYFAVNVNPGDSRVVAKLTDQTPILFEEKIGNGRVLLLASGLDNLTDDFPLHPVFVPFVEQTARYLSGTEDRGASRTVDSFLELRTAKEQSVGVEIVDPDGHRPLTLNEAASAQSFQLTQAGVYELHIANGRQDLIGVNPDPQESDLDVLPDDVQALWQGTPGQKPQQVAATLTETNEIKPYGVWWYVVALALLIVLAESLLSSQYLGLRREDL